MVDSAMKPIAGALKLLDVESGALEFGSGAAGSLLQRKMALKIPLGIAESYHHWS